MTAKEKAKELYHKYADEFNFDDTYRGYKEQSKQCALRAVYEIINIIDAEDQFVLYNYWQQVKQEIEKL